MKLLGLGGFFFLTGGWGAYFFYLFFTPLFFKKVGVDLLKYWKLILKRIN